MNKIQLPLVFTLLLALMMACNNANPSFDSGTVNRSSTVPIIKTTNGVKQLYVNNKPYLIIGAELLNSSASSIAHMSDIWKRTKALNVNTVYLPITWQQLEPKEGKFDYSLVDSHIKNAQKNGLKLIFLWFGSWKKGGIKLCTGLGKDRYETFPSHAV